MNRTTAAAPLVLAVLFALTACDPGANGSPSGSPTSSRTPTPTGSITATPTPTGSASSSPSAPAPGPAPAETPLSSRGAYDRCVSLASSLVYTGRPVTAAAYPSANVIARSDGRWYVYTEVTITDTTNPPERDVAFECILGGTVEHPDDQLYGAVVRSPLSSRDPNAAVPTED